MRSRRHLTSGCPWPRVNESTVRRGALRTWRLYPRRRRAPWPRRACRGAAPCGCPAARHGRVHDTGQGLVAIAETAPPRWTVAASAHGRLPSVMGRGIKFRYCCRKYLKIQRNHNENTTNRPENSTKIQRKYLKIQGLQRNGSRCKKGSDLVKSSPNIKFWVPSSNFRQANNS